MTYEDVAALSEITARQWGMVSSHQAGKAGVTRSQLSKMSNAGILERVSHGVYRLKGAPAGLVPEHVASEWVALVGYHPKLARPRALVVSGSAALDVHGLGVVDARTPTFIINTAVVDLEKPVRARNAHLVTRALDRWDVTEKDLLPVLTPAAAIADMLTTEPVDLSIAAEAIRDASLASTIDLNRLADLLNDYARSRHLPTGRDVVAAMCATIAGSEGLAA